MADPAEHGRAAQEGDVTDRGGRRDGCRGFGRVVGRGRHAEREAERGARAPERDAQEGDRQVRREDEDHEPERRGDRQRPERPHAPDPVDERAAERAEHRHRHREDGEEDRAGRLGLAVSVDDGDREPVVGAALGERHAEDDRADRVGARIAPHRESGVHPFAPRGHRPRRLCGDAFARRQVLQRETGDDEPDERNDPEVPRDPDAPPHDRDADAGARDRAQAEEGVEERHERAAERLLDRGRFDVDHDVGRAEAQPHQREAHHRHGIRAECVDAERGDEQSRPHADHRDRQAALRAPARHDHVRRHHARERTGAHGEQQHADLEVVDREVLLHGRQPRRPRREGHAAQQEQGEHRRAPVDEAGAIESGGGGHQSSLPNRFDPPRSPRATIQG